MGVGLGAGVEAGAAGFGGTGVAVEGAEGVGGGGVVCFFFFFFFFYRCGWGGGLVVGEGGCGEMKVVRVAGWFWGGWGVGGVHWHLYEGVEDHVWERLSLEIGGGYRLDG